MHLPTHMAIVGKSVAISVVAFAVLIPATASVRSETMFMTADEDRQRMLDQLHIKELRPGVTQSHAATANLVNYDESKAGSPLILPDSLLLKDGKPVSDAKTWWTKRRPEIVADFDADIYGRVPAHTPKVTWTVVTTTDGTIGTVATTTKKLVGHVDNTAFPSISVDIRMMLTTPAHAPGRVPILLQLTNDAGQGRDTASQIAVAVSWEEQVLERGWGYAILGPGSYQADNGAGLTEGIIGLCNQGQPRKPDEWGVLRAWAWGASRALDYLETDAAVDAHRIGLEGHSRYGKAALVAMAYEPRFAIAYVSSSGEGGAKLWRRNFGEMEGNIASAKEYHWVAGNFLRYAGPLKPADLPVDSHELIALCAPRPVFIGAGTQERGDGWVDPKGSFLAEVAAGTVYRLLGAKDLGATELPAVGTPLLGGDLAFRQHDGGHTDAPNWPTFLEFATRSLNPK